MIIAAIDVGSNALRLVIAGIKDLHPPAINEYDFEVINGNRTPRTIANELRAKVRQVLGVA